MELWLYVPENTHDKTKTKRKGWWLYPTQKPGHYYIGPFADIQNTKKRRQIADVAVFDDFPFTRSVQMNKEGVEISNTVKCITVRRLTAAELEEAKAGDDIFVSEDGTDDEVDDDSEEDTDDVMRWTKVEVGIPATMEKNQR